MKKIFPIFLLICISVASSASTTLVSRYSKNENSHFEANRLWKKYIACSQDPESEKKCLSQTLSKALNSAEVTKLFEFITVGFEVSTLTECSMQESEVFPEHSKKDFLCFKLYGNKSELTGYCFFDRKGNELRISKIKY